MSDAVEWCSDDSSDVVVVDEPKAAAARPPPMRQRSEAAPGPPMRAPQPPSRELWGRVRLATDALAAIQLSRACNDAALQKAVQEAVPAETMHALRGGGDGGGGGDVGGMLALLKWLRRTFRVEAGVAASVWTASRLVDRVLVRKQGAEAEICQVAVAALRAARVPARLVFELRCGGPATDALPDVWIEALLVAASAAGGQAAAQWHRAWGSAKAAADAETAFKAKDEAKVLASPRLGKTEADRLFVAAAGELGQLTDVTARYRAHMSEVAKLRQPWESWFHLNFVQPTAAEAALVDDAALQWARAALAPAVVLAERQQLAALEVDEAMPSSAAGFRAHPTLAVEAQLRAGERVKPGAQPVTHFKGQPVFHRFDVELLRTELAWKKHGRVVANGEAPVVPGRDGKRPRVVLDDWDEEDVRTTTTRAPPLYSESQTRAVEPERVVAGQLPLNAYGNVDFFHPAFLPLGAAFVEDEAPVQAIDIARQLRLQCARPIVDFERRDGKPRAVFRGAMVLEADAAMLATAVAQAAQARRHADAEALRECAAAQWWTLLALTGVAQRKRASVGVAGDGGTAAATAMCRQDDVEEL